MIEKSNLSEDVKNNFSKIIYDAFAKIELSATERKYFKNFYKFIGLFLIVWSIPILVLTLLSKILNWPLFVMIIGIILSVIFLSSGLVIYCLWAKSWKKVLKNFQQLDVLSGFYSDYITRVNENITINRLTNKIEGLPDSYQELYNAVYYRNTFVGEYHQRTFQLGTVVYEKVHSNSLNPRTQQKRTSYYKSLYLVINTKSTSVKTKVVGHYTELISKLTKSGIHEGAYSFKEFLTLNHEDKHLKTLLSSDVIKNLNFLIEKDANNLPVIIINDDEFILEWDLGLTHNSQTQFLAAIENVKNLNDIRIAILNNVDQNTEVLINCLKWIDAFKVIN